MQFNTQIAASTPRSSVSGTVAQTEKQKIEKIIFLVQFNAQIADSKPAWMGLWHKPRNRLPPNLKPTSTQNKDTARGWKKFEMRSLERLACRGIIGVQLKGTPGTSGIRKLPGLQGGVFNWAHMIAERCQSLGEHMQVLFFGFDWQLIFMPC